MEDKEHYREALRTGLAKGLTATARGLSAASHALASTAHQLRPPERADPWEEPGSIGTQRGASLDAVPHADIDALASQTVREILAELDDLTKRELSALREAEAAGKARKTVLQAVDRALSK